MTERELRDRLVKRDEEALSVLYDRLAPRVYGLARSMLGEGGEAEEVVSDTFVQVWESIATFDASRGRLDGWVISICRSRALDRLRTDRRRRSLAEGAVERIAKFTTGDPAPDPEDRALARTDLSARVRPALDELVAEQRRAIELAYLGGLSQSEIAEALDVPLGTVKTRIRTGMQKLRKALREPSDFAASREGGDA